VQGTRHEQMDILKVEWSHRRGTATLYIYMYVQ